MKRVLRSQADYRSTLLRNQLTSVILFETIVTTATKAKLLEPFANHFFNRVKDGSLTGKRFAHQTLLDENATKKVFEEILPRFKSAETTFVRSYRLMPRRGDSASQMMIALIRPLEVTETAQPSTEASGAASKPKTSRRRTATAKKDA